jgi:peptide/nickel transport system substrate-binding protein
MMKRLIRLAAVAATAAATLAVSACGNGGTVAGSSGSSGSTTAADSTPETGGTVNFLAQADFSHLDPTRGYDGGVDNFYQLLYRTLVMWKAVGGGKSEIVPDLASSLGTPSDDYKTWTFHLRNDIYFQNGQPITSQDLKFGIERAWDPQAGIGSPYAKTLIAAAASYKGPYEDGSTNAIQTPNSKTIVFHLNQSYPDFNYAATEPNFVAFPVGTGNDDVFDKHPIASGPYEVASYTPGASLVLTRNPDWKRSSDPNRPAYPNKITFTFGLSGATIDQRLLADQSTDQNAIGLWGIQASTVAKIQTEQMKERTVSGPQGCTGYVALNTTDKPLNNLQVREAIEWATDKQTMVDAAGGTVLAAEATSIESPTVPDRTTTNVYATAGGTGDVAKAKELLKEAGYANGFTITLQTMNDPISEGEGVAFQAALARAGITVKLDEMSVSSFYQTIGTVSQEADAAQTGWCPDWPGGLTFLPPLFDSSQYLTSVGNGDLSMIQSSSLNAQFASIAKIANTTEQNEAYAQLDVQIQKMALIVPTVYANTVELVGTNVAGAYPSAPWDSGVDFVSVGLKNPNS